MLISRSIYENEFIDIQMIIATKGPCLGLLILYDELNMKRSPTMAKGILNLSYISPGFMAVWLYLGFV